MDDISYVAAVGASIVAGLILWWACGRYQSRITRALFSVITIFVGFLVYFLLGILFIVMRPGIAHETGLAINHGLKVLTTMLLAVNAAILALRSKARKKAVQKQPEGDVRERLLKARGDIQRRIENLKTSPVLNYRGGIPEPDLIIEELTEKLKEIEAALATLETKRRNIGS
jgi:hypothetical protein